MAVTDIVYDNWGNATEIDMLYQEGVASYELETSAGITYIQEPVQWDKVQFVHKRDAKYHGFNYEFTGPDIDLIFDMYSGREAIMAEYELTGNDGLVIFRRKLSFGATTIIEYEGKLRLGDMKRQKYMPSIPCERKSLHTLINSRLNTKINITSATDLDDAPVDVFVEDFLSLPGQTLAEKFKAQQLVLKQESFTETRTGDDIAILFFNVSDPIYNTMQGFIGSTLGISGDPESITNDTHNLFEFPFAGSYDFVMTVDFEVTLRIHPRFLAFGKKVEDASLNVQLNLLKGTGLDMTIETHTIANVPVFHPNTQGFVYPRVTATETIHLDVDAGDRCVFFAYLSYEHNANQLKSVDISVKEYKTIVEVTGTSNIDPSLTSGFLIKRAMKDAMARITGRDDVIQSDFYSLADDDHPTDGCGANRMLLNGGRIRKAGSQFPMTFSWSSLLTSMNAIDAIGMGYEWNATDQLEVVRIEPKEYFYNDVEIIEIDVVSDYVESVANDQIYNKIKIGYGKYKEEDENSLNEIHAYHEYQTPIKTETNSYEMISEFLASGNLIEVTRRAYFLDDETAATPYDDDVFILHVQQTGPLDSWVPVNEEPFDDVTGVPSPETTVNMTLSIKRMLMAHAKWLMSSLVYKNASELLKNTFTKQNKWFSTTLKADYCKRGDEALLPLQADADVILSAFGDFTGIYSPEWVNFKARLGMSQIRMIMNAHRGLDPDGNNYGYITYTDDFGVKRKGWLYELAYNRMSEEVSMKLLKKKFPL